MALLLLRLAVSEIVKSSDRGKSLNKGKNDWIFYCSFALLLPMEEILEKKGR